MDRRLLRPVRSAPVPMLRVVDRRGDNWTQAVPQLRPPRAAICLTGLQRSFPEVGGNIKEALGSLLTLDATEIFGVRPATDPWDAIRRLLPLHRVVPQVQCHR